MNGASKTCGMLSIALQPALAFHMLPCLRAKDWGSLGCVCKAAHELLKQAALNDWREVAAEILPLNHPALQFSQVEQ